MEAGTRRSNIKVMEELTDYPRHQAFRLTRRGASRAGAAFGTVIVLIIALGLGYYFGKNISLTPVQRDLGLVQRTSEKETATPSPVALAKFTSEKYSITFSYPQTWGEDSTGASLVGTEKVAKFKTTDFSDEKSTSITGARLEVLKFSKKQTEASALEQSATYEGYEAVELGKESKIGDAKIKVWEFKIDPTNKEVYKDANPKTLKRVFGIARIFVSETEAYVLNFEGASTDELKTFDEILTSLSFEKKESTQSGEGTSSQKKATPTPLPTNATYFEGQ